ncbi:MAG: cyclic nucleotide-binding domain-containing protein [Elusimicrobiota bacterium]|jgi:CRP/FNR family transcriptional regulator
MTVTEFLQDSVPFLKGIGREQAHVLAQSAQQVAYNDGQVVLFKGVTVDGLHVVAMGRVAVYVPAGKGQPAVKVADLGPGEVFGEISILEQGTAGATIKAAQDDTLVFVIPQDAFREVLAKNPEFNARILALIAARKEARAQKK